MSSLQWITVSDLLAFAGIALAILSAVLHWRAYRARKPAVNLASTATFWFLLASGGAMVLAAWRRYIEVNHFPSQTMSEVLMMFSLALLLSMAILHLALGLHRRGPGWAILDDVLVAAVLSSVWFLHEYTRGLNTAQRDLPPALQSYWFSPHLLALILSYALLGIAGLICLKWFCMRFWVGVFNGGRTRKSQILIAAGLLLVPFAQVVTAPMLLLSGLAFLGLKLAGKLPAQKTLDMLEKDFDEVSYRAFSVGIPFLTAGLFMGAFWAQEAWANYWGWDSKENSALISWLVYVVYIHLRMLGGYRGEKAMAVLMGGALSIFFTFQIFGYLPDSQKSLHRYTDDGVVPKEGMQGGVQESSVESASLPATSAAGAAEDRR